MDFHEKTRASFFGWFCHIAQDPTPPPQIGGSEAHIPAKAKNQAFFGWLSLKANPSQEKRKKGVSGQLGEKNQLWRLAKYPTPGGDGHPIEAPADVWWCEYLCTSATKKHALTKQNRPRGPVSFCFGTLGICLMKTRETGFKHDPKHRSSAGDSDLVDKMCALRARISINYEEKRACQGCCRYCSGSSAGPNTAGSLIPCKMRCAWLVSVQPCTD